MKKIPFNVVTPTVRENGVIRIDPVLHARIAELARVTRQTMTSVANTLLAEALASVELVPVPLYDMKMTGGSDAET